VEICFVSNRLKKACSESREGDRIWGEQNARKIRQRLVEFRAAETLADVSALPPARCHELKGERKGQFAVDCRHPYKLVFKPAHNPVPRLENGGIDLAVVTEILVLEVVDYHGE